MTIQIPRLALDAKNAQGQDVPFKVTIEGYGPAGKKSKVQTLTAHYLFPLVIITSS
jgi:hypothetical protein